jgi:HK97 family phage prohead protease
MKRETRFTPQKRAHVAIERRADESPSIFGYAAVFYDGTPETEYELWTNVRERIMPGAFDRAIGEGDDVRGLFNHDANNLLGRSTAETLALRADDTGLRYDIQPPDTQIGRDVVTMIERGDLTGSSFAFIVTDEDWRKEDKQEIREIRGVQLFDVGPVTYPAYEATTTNLRDSDGALESYRQWQTAQRARRIRAEILQKRIWLADKAIES